MSSKLSSEIKANLERAEQAVNAARKLAADGYYDFAASRAYYSVFTLLQRYYCMKDWNSVDTVG